MAFGTLKADTLTHSTAGSLDTNYVVNGSAKAWAADTDGDGTTINNSLNVSSKTDEGTGDFNYTLINSAFEEMDAYAFGSMCFGGSRFVRGRGATTTTSVLDILVTNNAATAVDSPHGWMWVGELA